MNLALRVWRHIRSYLFLANQSNFSNFSRISQFADQFADQHTNLGNREMMI